MDFLLPDDYIEMMIPFREDGRRKVCQAIKERLIAGGIEPETAERYTEMPYEDSKHELKEAMIKQQERFAAYENWMWRGDAYEEGFIKGFKESVEERILEKRKKLIADGVSPEEAERQIPMPDLDDPQLQKALTAIAWEDFEKRHPRPL